MLAANSRIVLGSHVIFGPGVMVYAGNHNTGQQGRFMADVTEKRPEDDLEVVFEDDIWVGGGSIILQGVTVGRGSVIGAGSVVVRDVPPYCLVAGVPARPLKARWTLDGVIAHEALLYPINERLGREALSAAWQAAGLPGS
jgi:maltose O-acetyltransferase